MLSKCTRHALGILGRQVAAGSENMFVVCNRHDMNAEDLTEKGMRQGGWDSDVFLLFLTNAVLSRTYCLKEITWYVLMCTHHACD